VKIGIFDPYLDDIGGGERYMMTIASCLSQKNSVDVFWDSPKDLRKIEERFSLNLSKVNLVPNIFDPFFSVKKKLVKSREYDAIVFLSDGSIPFLLSKKLFIHIQRPIVEISITFKDKMKLKRVDKVFVNSEFTKKYVDKVYLVDSQLLYPPVSIFGNTKKKENMILHVGRFRVLNVNAKDYKKQQVMIDTFKDLVDKGLKNWKFILAVSLPDIKDPNFVFMQDSTKGYPIEFLINSSNEKLWEVGSKAKIYWHASGFGEDLEKHPELAEHFGISTVEAMGVGAVPVVINAGGQKEIIKDGENGFLWNSISEFEKKTLKLIDDEKLWTKLSDAAFQRSKYFSEDKFYDRVIELIK